MVRVLGRGVFGGVVAVAALLLLSVSPAIAADEPPPVVALGTGVDDFTFDSFSADYTLGRDGGGHSTLLVEETLVAVFPTFDQNRGIIRAIPTKYDGHGTRLDVLSVTDGDGAARQFAIGTDGDFTTITIAVPEGQYVHGVQTYVIAYTQMNVTKFFKDTDDDEFYWDTNGTGWDQPFGSISAAVLIEPALRDELNGTTACYFGYEGSTDTCELRATADGFEASVTDANPRQNLTIAIGFEAGTFADAPFNVLDYIPLAPLLALLALVASVVIAIVTRLTVLRDHRGSTVVAQYQPQPGISPWLAANVWGKPKKGMPATIIDLAVRGKIKILERPDPSGFGRSYGVQEVDASGLEQDSARAMYVLFSTGFFTAPSRAERWFVKRDVLLGSQVRSLGKTIEAEELALGLRRRAPRWPAVVMVLLGIVAFLIFILGTFGSDDDDGAGIVLGVLGANLVPWLTIFLVGRVAGRSPLTEAGAQVHDYLEGMRLYIRLAEADRLQMLQSVTGAQRVSGLGGGGDVVKIYEKLLPYALIFGLEREWGETLERYYDTTPPDWYAGEGISAFRAGAFATGIASFSSSIASTTSYSSSGGSSSGGGSSGGGSSGGGGGGGGGGGI
jgi:hypothetical protein